MIRYFAYGSNLSSHRLRARTPSAVADGVAILRGWTLAFDKHGRDGTAKANIVPAPRETVWGVVYRIDRAERPRLDAAEGLGFAYADRWLEVDVRGRGPARVLSYVAIDVRAGLSVPSWYLGHMLAGAREHGLPAIYVESMRARAGGALTSAARPRWDLRSR